MAYLPKIWLLNWVKNGNNFLKVSCIVGESGVFLAFQSQADNYDAWDPLR